MSHTSAWNASVMNSVVVKGERLPCMLTQFLAGASLDIVAHAGGGEGLDAGRLRPGGFTSLLLLGHGWTEKSGNSCAMKARVLVLTWAGAASSVIGLQHPLVGGRVHFDSFRRSAREGCNHGRESS